LNDITNINKVSHISFQPQVSRGQCKRNGACFNVEISIDEELFNSEDKVLRINSGEYEQLTKFYFFFDKL